MPRYYYDRALANRLALLLSIVPRIGQLHFTDVPDNMVHYLSYKSNHKIKEKRVRTKDEK